MENIQVTDCDICGIVEYHKVMKEILGKCDCGAEKDLIQKWQDEAKKEGQKKKAERVYRDPLMRAKKILLPEDFVFHSKNNREFKCQIVTNPGMFSEGKNTKLIVRHNPTNFAYSGLSLVECNLDELFKEDGKYEAKLLRPPVLPYESIEDARYSPDGKYITYVSLYWREPMVTMPWLKRDSVHAPIIVEDTFLRNNRDCFFIGDGLISLRPGVTETDDHYIVFGKTEKNNPNIVEETFVPESSGILIPQENERKLGGSTAVKINSDETLYLYHSTSHAIDGKGVYMCYGLLVDNDGCINSYCPRPLTMPEPSKYFGIRPGTNFIGGGIVDGSDLVLVGGTDDTVISAYRRDLGEILSYFIDLKSL